MRGGKAGYPEEPRKQLDGVNDDDVWIRTLFLTALGFDGIAVSLRSCLRMWPVDL